MNGSQVSHLDLDAPPKKKRGGRPQPERDFHTYEFRCLDGHIFERISLEKPTVPLICPTCAAKSYPVGEEPPKSPEIVAPAEHEDFAAAREVVVNVQAPPIRTESLITEATVKAIQSIEIAQRLRIKRLNVEPAYSIGDDSQLLSAEVTVKFVMIFPLESE